MKLAQFVHLIDVYHHTNFCDQRIFGTSRKRTLNMAIFRKSHIFIQGSGKRIFTWNFCVLNTPLRLRRSGAGLLSRPFGPVQQPSKAFFGLRALASALIIHKPARGVRYPLGKVKKRYPQSVGFHILNTHISICIEFSVQKYAYHQNLGSKQPFQAEILRSSCYKIFPCVSSSITPKLYDLGLLKYFYRIQRPKIRL